MPARRLSLLAALSCCAAPLLAQDSIPPAIDRGSLLVSGGASFQRQRTRIEVDGVQGSSTSTTTSLSLAPAVLFFVRPGLALGGDVQLGYSDFGGGSATSFAVGPAARYYFGRGAARTLPYLGASARVGRFTIEQDEGPATGEREGSLWGVEATAGLTWLVSRQVGVFGEAHLGRTVQSVDQGANDTDNTATGFGLRFGVSAFLPRR
ncbi:hypothetical protein [Roseisolibacter sp. H3M3-2]|uniref:outer membrane beta-barrel protein n=1 Tax=Roseisolibacter sp. H3M3-2 TaxID=3031323 RepID=UPI0023DCAF96|nr:hypothetical protein [Roseisolibacter sp. H3M3-2]MDF1505053.1 hypothetical protein [Roseisolibacter sp. H3M3-2]